MRPARTVGRQDGNEQQGLEAGFEQKAGRKRLDVFAHVDSLRVVLEGLTGFHIRLTEEIPGRSWEQKAGRKRLDVFAHVDRPPGRLQSA